MKSVLLFLLIWFAHMPIQSQVSNTYTSGHIPTYLTNFNSGCEGILAIQLPFGEDVEVLGVNITYSMTSFGDNWTADQRSRVRSVNTNMVESTYSGANNANGTYEYYRENVPIANGIYTGGTILQFEMETYRTFDDGLSPICNDLGVRVNNGTWTIEVSVDQQGPLIGVNTTTPDQSLSVEGKLSIGNDFKAPTVGTMRYNSITNKFEGWTGASWKSMSYSPTVYSYEQNAMTNSYSSTIRDSLLSFPDSLLVVEPGKYMCVFDMTFENLNGNTTSLSSDIRLNVLFNSLGYTNTRNLGGEIIGLPGGFTYFFRTNEIVQMNKIIEVTSPNTYMHIRYRVRANTCCAAPTSIYYITNVKMTAIKLD